MPHTVLSLTSDTVPAYPHSSDDKEPINENQPVVSLLTLTFTVETADKPACDLERDLKMSTVASCWSFTFNVFFSF